MGGGITDTVEFNLSDTELSHTYMLVVSWDDSELDYRYSGEVDYVQITLSSNQMD